LAAIYVGVTVYNEFDIEIKAFHLYYQEMVNRKMTEEKSEKVWRLAIRSSDNNLIDHILQPGLTTLGRDEENSIVLYDFAVSSYHAEIQFDRTTNTVTIHDLESTNGTFVNGKRLHEAQILRHDDQIRIGPNLIAISYSELGSSYKQPVQPSRTKVTGELILESIDQYGVLLHEVGQRLVNLPNLDNSLTEIVELIQRMLGAEKCQIVLEDNFDNLNGLGIPTAHARKTIENQSAIIFSDALKELSSQKEPDTQRVQSMMLVPVIISQRVVALIFAKKSKHSSYPFNSSDLQLVLAISNQVAMSIQRSRVEGELLHKSHHDSLTDLPNRAFFLERLSQSILRSKKEKGFVFAVLFFDIDDFKVVNDSLGHEVGDKLLIAIAERLKHNVRNIDIVARNSVIARFGGDEFAILLDDVKESLYAFATANRLKDILSRPFNINGKQIFSTVSIGVAVSMIGYEKPEDILRDADMAMYHAKDLGKARVEIYEKSMHDRISQQMHMGTVLRQGALQKEFQLHYQPIVSLQTKRIVGYEALMRWYTPDRGILNPADFMDALDTTGLIYSTDHWVLQTACRQAVKWGNKFPGEHPVFISVNLSAKNIKHPNLLENIKHVLKETNLEPGRLWLEITEKVSAPDDASAIDVLGELRSLGIRISLDDFGSGYSALNYLAQFPIDVLKIDHSFVKMIGKNESSQKVIEMIKTLTSHLGLILVAEGVEKAEQAAYLETIGCEYAQGFFYAKPLETEKATQLLAKGGQW
jgi:diguanylate cyclase (GGDEF)-like protein